MLQKDYLDLISSLRVHKESVLSIICHGYIYFKENHFLLWKGSYHFNHHSCAMRSKIINQPFSLSCLEIKSHISYPSLLYLETHSFQ